MMTKKLKNYALSTLLAVSSSLIAIPSVSADTLENIRNKGLLNFAVYKDFPPYSYVEKGIQKGIDVEIAKRLGEEMSLQVAIRMVGADENMSDDLRNNIWKGHYLGGGTADIMLHAPHDKAYSEKEDLVAFLAPYQIESLAFAIDKSKLGNSPTLANFTQSPIGVEIDTLSDSYLLRALGGKVMDQVRHYTTLSDAISDLKAGKIAAVMGPRGELEGILGANMPEQLAIQRIITPGLSKTTWAMGAAVKARNKKLAAATTKAMLAIIRDGSVEKIFKKYHVAYTPAVSVQAAN